MLDERYDEMDDLVRARSLPSMQLAGSPSGETLDLNALTGARRPAGRPARGAMRDGAAAVLRLAAQRVPRSPT